MDESSQLTYADVERIVALVEEGGFGRVRLESGGLTLDLVRAGYVGQADAAAPPAPVHSPAPAPSRPAPAEASPAPEQTSAAQPAASAASTASAGAETTAATAEEGPVIVSPMLGIFYATPDPESPPYVEVGQTIEAGTTVGLVEVMKMFTAVHAEVAGTVTAVLVENGQQVQRGQALFRLSEG